MDPLNVLVTAGVILYASVIVLLIAGLLGALVKIALREPGIARRVTDSIAARTPPSTAASSPLFNRAEDLQVGMVEDANPSRAFVPGPAAPLESGS